MLHSDCSFFLVSSFFWFLPNFLTPVLGRSFAKQIPILPNKLIKNYLYVHAKKLKKHKNVLLGIVHYCPSRGEEPINI